jgi:hypothetical protein
MQKYKKIAGIFKRWDACCAKAVPWLLILNTMKYWFHQYGETNMMQFLFNLLRIKGLYMFQALLGHPQEVLQKWDLVYCVRVVSVGCTSPGTAN